MTVRYWLTNWHPILGPCPCKDCGESLLLVLDWFGLAWRDNENRVHRCSRLA